MDDALALKKERELLQVSLADRFPTCHLSESEVNALAYALKGLTSKESAELLGIKPVTVRTYLSRAYQKLGCSCLEDVRTALALDTANQSVAAAQNADGCDSDAADLQSDVLRKARSAIVPPALVAAVGALLGICICDDVFGHALFFFPEIQVPALFILVLALYARLLRAIDLQGSSGARDLLLLAVLPAIVLLGALQGFFIQGVLCLLFALLFWAALRTRRANPRWFSGTFMLLGMGMGALVARLFVAGSGVLDRWWEFIFTHQTGYAKLAIGTYAYGALSLLVAGLFSWFLLSSFDLVDDSSSDDWKKRVLYYCLARGASDLQGHVCVLIVLGYSTSMIARELSYSVGSINTARNALYKKLDVHSKSQLVDLIAKNVGAP